MSDPSASPSKTPEPLWRPSPERVSATNAHRFMAAVGADWGVSLPTFTDLYQFSVEQPEKFWVSLKDFAGIIGGPWDGPVLLDADRMPGARWFPEAKINFAENLLRLRDDSDAMVFWGEDRVRRRLSHNEVYDRVWRLAQGLRAAGVGPGDRVGAYIPNMPEAVIALLASASIGAVFSSCSPDFGVQGVLDRFGQIEPKLLIAADGYHYNGKTHDGLEKLKGIVDGLPSVRAAVVVPYVRDDPNLDGIRCGVLMDDFIAPYAAASDGNAFERFPFNHPLVILYSSGTTGAPKCIVHGIGGSLLQHAREHLIHCDIKPGDRVFYFSTCGWMMWNWLVGTIAWGATLLLYDGSPFYPSPTQLFDFADAEGATLFGTSAKFIDAVAKAGAEPARTHKLDTVRTITSTGSPPGPRIVRLRLRQDQGRRSPGLHLRGHRHHGLFRLGRSDRARLAGGNPDPGAGHGHRGVRRGRQAVAPRQGRAGLYQPVPLHAGEVLERSRRRKNTAPPISKNTRASGATATGWRSPGTAG